MFSSQNEWIMVAGVLLGLMIIGVIVYSINKMFSNATQDVLVRFIIMVFGALVGIFIVDKVVAFKRNLLDPELSKELFQLIKTLILMIFSYYFGTQKSGGDKRE